MKEMRSVLFFVALICSIETVSGYCYAQIVHEAQCTTRDGITMPVGSELDMPDKCEKCSCHTIPGETALHMSCCGYGIHAGVFGPPPGCKVVAGEDGCSVKMVQLLDESLPCSH